MTLTSGINMPALPQQQFLAQQSEVLHSTSTQARIRIHGDLDLQKLETAIRNSLEALPVLTCDRLTGDQANVVLSNPGDFNLEILSQAPHQLDQENQTRPHFRCFPSGTNEHILEAHFSAMAADIPSLQLWLDALIQQYQFGKQEPSVPFEEVAQWEAEIRADEDAASGFQHWQDQVFTAQAPLIGVTVKTPTGPANWRKVTQHSLKLPFEDLADLQHQCAASWASFLAGFSNSTKITINTAQSTRPEGMESCVGPLARWLPTQLTVPAATTLNQLSVTFAQAFASQDDWALFFQPAKLNHSRDYGFVFTEAMPSSSDSQLDWHLEEAISFPLPMNLLLQCYKQGNRLSLHLYYDEHRLDRAQVNALLESFSTRLQAALANPSKSLNQLPRLSQQQQQQVGITREWPTGQWPDLLETIQAKVLSTPSAIALQHQQQSYTYEQLWRNSNQLANQIQQHNVGSDNIVGLFLPRCYDWIVTALASLKCNAAFVTIDPDFPASRRREILTHCQLVVTQQNLAEQLDASIPQLVIDAQTPPLYAQDSSETMQWVPISTATAYVIFTSGSTGKPKGVAVSRAAMSAFCHSARAHYELQAEDRVIQFASLNFDTCIEEIFPALMAGATILLRQDAMLDPAKLLETCQNEAISILDLPTAFWHQLAVYLEQEELYLPGSVRLTIIGGEAAHLVHLKRWQKAARNSNSRVINSYGPTEATVVATLWRDDMATLQDLNEIPIGKPLNHVTTYVLDAKFQPLPPECIGQLYIGGHALARGYLQQPAETAARFIPDPFSKQPGARLYATGDLVKVQQGQLMFVGRADHQVKVRGYRIELGEIENQLLNVPGVEQAVVLVQAANTPQTSLIAYVQCAKAAEFDREGCRKALAHHLPDYMMPQIIVALDQFPLTHSGKVDRKALPEPEVQDTAGTNNEMLNPEEQLMINIWQELIPQAQIHRDSDFFRCGGHSLMATQLIARVRKAFGIDLPLQTLFEHSILSDFTHQVLHAGRDAAMPYVPLERKQGAREFPLSFAQQRMWIIYHMNPTDVSYNMPIALRIKGNLDHSLLNHTIQELVQRHETLRTRFESRDGEAIQIVEELDHFDLPIIDLSHLPEPEAEQAAREQLAKRAAQPFQLGIAPLMRAALYQLNDDHHILMFCLHHIIYDGWSENVLVKEAVSIYTALQEKREHDLVPLHIQYGDYSLWQRNVMTEARMNHHLEFYSQYLSGDLPKLNLPLDFPDRQSVSNRGSYHSFNLKPELCQKLREFNLKHGTTDYMTLMTVFNLFLASVCKQEDLIVGTPIAGRNYREIENLIGFFINNLVIRTDLHDDPTFISLVEQVRKTTLSANAHQDLPFDKLVEHFDRSRNSDDPLFQVTFSVNNTPKSGMGVSGLEFSSLDESRDEVRYDLTLWIHIRENHLQGIWSYRSERFKPETVAAFSDRFCQIVETVLEQPSIRLNALRFALESQAPETTQPKKLDLSNLKSRRRRRR